MDDMAVRLDTVRCPRCHLGFAPGTRSCPVCHVPLSASRGTPVPSGRTVHEIEPHPEEATTASELEDDPAELVALRTAPPAWVRALLERLRASGIPARTKPSPRPPDLTVFVRSEDQPRAARIDREVFAAEVPESGRAPDVEQFDPGRCPGCGATVDTGAHVCPECELALVQPDGWRCGSCGASMEPDAPICRACGAGIDRAHREGR